MAITAEIQHRLDLMLSDLDHSLSGYTRLAKLNYRFSVLLSYATVVTSLGAGAGGILLKLDGEKTGILALVPVVLATFAINLKFQDKANWHYRKKDALNAFKRQLLYQLNESNAEEKLNEISMAWNDLDRNMDEQWEKEFAFPWTNYLKGPSRG